MAMQDASDLRARYAIKVPLGYRSVAERGHRRNVGWTRDLSSLGAWVELPEQVEPGSTLEITLATPVGNLSLTANVAWMRPGLLHSRYLHGLSFPVVTPAQREQLCTLVAYEKPPPVRLYCTLAATCQRKGVGCLALPGAIRNLSENGACVHLPEPMARGTEMCIRTATRLGEMAADARVVWADPERAGRSGDASYSHGLRFVRIYPLSERPLRALLYGVQ